MRMRWLGALSHATIERVKWGRGAEKAFVVWEGQKGVLGGSWRMAIPARPSTTSTGGESSCRRLQWGPK